MRKLIIFVALLILAAETRFFEMTKAKMGELRKEKKNYLFHLVFINEDYVSPFQEFLKAHFVPNLILYRTDCEKTKFPECMNKKSYPLFLLYNKVIMHFPGTETSFENVFEWINSTVFKNPISNILQKSELQKLVEQKRELFIMFATNTSQTQKLAYATLSKQFFFSTFVYLTDQNLGEELKMKTGVICQMVLNTNDSVCLNSPPNYDKFSSFVLEKFISFLPRANSLVGKRFLNQQININTYIIGCDLSFACLKIWQSLIEAETELQNLGIQLKKIILGSKQNELFESYFHIKVNSYRSPVLIHLSQTNTNTSVGMPKRYLRQFNHTSFGIQSIKAFIEDIQNNRIQELVLSEGALKKNGFGGKKGEKNIQRLSYDSYQKEIEQSEESFVVLVNRFDKECEKCGKLYENYKKSISYLISEGVNFRYGVIDMDRNQIDIPEIRRVPEILFYGGDRKNGMRIQSWQFSGLTGTLRKKYGEEKGNIDL